MEVYVDVVVQVVTKGMELHTIWPFKEQPAMPLSDCDLIEHEDRDTPIRYARDSSGQWWMDNGRNHPLEKCEYSDVASKTNFPFLELGQGRQAGLKKEE